jgi:hypothetical protein
MLTKHTAQDTDVWPGEMPPPEVRAEIRQIALTEIKAEDIAGSHLAPWYAPFHVAEMRYHARQEQRGEQQKTQERIENRNERRIAKLEQRLQKNIISADDIVVGCKIVLDIAARWCDLTEMRVLTSLAKRFDPEIGKELDNRFEVARKDANEDRKKPEREELKYFYDRCADAIKTHAGLQYKGTWQQNVEYRPGDTCTYGGSLWIAKSRSQGQKPDAAPGLFQLCVKHGRDGRNGKDGSDGKRVVVAKGHEVPVVRPGMGITYGFNALDDAETGHD